MKSPATTREPRAPAMSGNTPPVRRRIQHRLGALIAAFAITGTCGAIQVTDDAGNKVTLEAPARRILSLAPHITELLFAAGAGGSIAGAIEYSDFPEAARGIPRIGNHATLDIERILSLRPDLVIVWTEGNAQKQLRPLLATGIPAYYNQPRTLDDVARSLQAFGVLAGTSGEAERMARDFRVRAASLRERVAGRAPVSVFYQISHKPFMTLNGRHLTGEVLRLCGATALFAELPVAAPTVSLEAIVAADPEAIIATSARRDALDVWAKWPQVRAVKNGNLIGLDGSLLNRQGPRIIDGAEQLCAALERVRKQRPGGH
jgi:iron complex transport system substrate-binding protein